MWWRARLCGVHSHDCCLCHASRDECVCVHVVRVCGVYCHSNYDHPGRGREPVSECVWEREIHQDESYSIHTKLSPSYCRGCLPWNNWPIHTDGLRCMCVCVHRYKVCFWNSSRCRCTHKHTHTIYACRLDTVTTAWCHVCISTQGDDRGVLICYASEYSMMIGQRWTLSSADNTIGYWYVRRMNQSFWR